MPLRSRTGEHMSRAEQKAVGSVLRPTPFLGQQWVPGPPWVSLMEGSRLILSIHPADVCTSEHSSARRPSPRTPARLLFLSLSPTHTVSLSLVASSLWSAAWERKMLRNKEWCWGDEGGDPDHGRWPGPTVGAFLAPLPPSSEQPATGVSSSCSYSGHCY